VPPKTVTFIGRVAREYAIVGNTRRRVMNFIVERVDSL
jgi:hypothetical protein